MRTGRRDTELHRGEITETLKVRGQKASINASFTMEGKASADGSFKSLSATTGVT
jgi:hypothetical protein